MKAIIAGVSGATGRDLLDLLLNDDSIEQICVFVRRDSGFSHKKMTVHTIDFDHPEQWEKLVIGDVLFSCIGTTLKTAGSKEAQKKVDYNYQLDFANAAKRNNVGTYVLVSAEFASSSSPIFYSRIKGMLEDEVKKLKFPKLIIFKPPILVRKHSDRKMEVLSVKILHFFNSLGLFKSAQPMTTELLAKAMLNSAGLLKNGAHIIQGQKIRKYAEKSGN